MKGIRIVLPAVLVLGLAGFAVCQEQQEESKPAERSQPKPDADREAPRQDEAKPPKERDETKAPKQEQQEQKPDAEKPSKNEGNREMKPAPQERGEQTQHQSQQEHARPAGQSAHIPDDKFRAHFGHEHTFKVNRTVVVEGQPRFQYSGYWFVLSDPWPAEWAYTDDCYVDYIDGEYFLFDLLHPGVRIAVFVVSD